MDAGRHSRPRRKDTTLIFETQFNDILISELNPNTQLCANQRENGPSSDYHAIVSKVPDAPDYPHTLRFAVITFYACRATRIRNCGNPACVAAMDHLKSVMPACHTWPGLERWALQVAACWCSRQASNLSHDAQRVWSEVTAPRSTYPKLAPDVMSYTGKPATFANWARQVNHREVIPLLSWLYGLFSGTYEDMSMHMREFTPTQLTDGYRDRAIRQAILRARELHLCPHRVWAIAFSMPGQEANIPALVPDKHSPCSYKHDYCSAGPSHKNCTYDYCEISAVNFTNVVQCHRPNCDGKCENKLFPVRLLDKAATENRPTAWAIDGELRPLESGERYMTISHVWSDGTGGSGSVNKCMYDFFCDVARKLDCRGLWWDAICIPQDKHARAKAISHMHEYYSQAACTVVHDACLGMSEWTDSNHASFELVMSNWFTRGWTALELARSKQVEVLFGTREPPGYVLKNLDVDIVSGRGVVSSLPRQASSTAIQSLRKKSRSGRDYMLNDVLTALGPRFTSWARDRAIIAGQFVGIEALADQYSIYQQVVCKIGLISADQLFHNVASPAGPFAWFPSSLFDLPVSAEMVPQIEVLKDGSLLGEWGIILLPVNFQFSWDAMHPMSRHCVREALDDERHIILFECYKHSISRGLLVEVMKDTGPSYDMLCRYVGPVYFAPLPMDAAVEFASHPQFYSVLISNSGANLDMGVNAVDHIKSLGDRGLALAVRGGLLKPV
ncbi:hypothetical protein APHAL10511_008024 [Amanita phalloides]|nr:hypothetical protein APHAL10511_008024 [Amanita phalloides]